jgi:hypothetical protein
MKVFKLLSKQHLLALLGFVGVGLLTVSTAMGPISPIKGAGSQRYRLIWTYNPQNLATIAWDSTAKNHEGSVVHYGTENHGENLDLYPYQKKVDKVDRYKGMNNSFASLSDLEPDTAYYFVINSDRGNSPVFWFKTAPDDDQPISIIAGGDSRNNRGPRVNGNAMVAKLRPLAVLFAGDFTNIGTSKEWMEWMDDWQSTITMDNRLIPIIPGRGNHEISDEELARLFDIPAENYYSLNLSQLATVIALNSESSIAGKQTLWLENQLLFNSEIPWKIAFFHKPIRPHVARKSEGNEQYRNWAELFFHHKVNLVVEGDSHTVKRTWPLRPVTFGANDEGFVRDDEEGTVYIGEGCWGAPLRPADDTKSWTRASDSFNQLNWIFINKDQMEIRTIKTDGVAQVQPLTEDTLFEEPKGIEVWKPDGDGIIRILR